MSSELDFYDRLGVPRTATPQEIQTAYRALAALYHPDKHVGNPLAALAEEKLTQLNEAYETLSDPERRARYDERGTASARKAVGLMRQLWRVAGVLLVLFLFIRLGLRTRGGLMLVAALALALIVALAVIVLRALRNRGHKPRR
jgi:preprotein translocase subunit Sec63